MCSEPQCPKCGAGLTPVVNPPGSYLNDDQFDSVRKGAYYCDKCPEPGQQYRYWWDRDLTPAPPSSGDARDTGELHYAVWDHGELVGCSCKQFIPEHGYMDGAHTAHALTALRADVQRLREERDAARAVWKEAEEEGQRAIEERDFAMQSCSIVEAKCMGHFRSTPVEDQRDDGFYLLLNNSEYWGATRLDALRAALATHSAPAPTPGDVK